MGLVENFSARLNHLYIKIYSIFCIYLLSFIFIGVADKCSPLSFITEKVTHYSTTLFKSLNFSSPFHIYEWAYTLLFIQLLHVDKARPHAYLVIFFGNVTLLFSEEQINSPLPQKLTSFVNFRQERQ